MRIGSIVIRCYEFDKMLAFWQEALHNVTREPAKGGCAEALSEISGRLEGIPGEESFPAYLSSRIAQFFERAGRITTLNGDAASICAIGAVTARGGDFSEPVIECTMHHALCFPKAGSI